MRFDFVVQSLRKKSVIQVRRSQQDDQMVAQLTILRDHLADLLLRHYDPRFATGDVTFPYELDIPGLLEPRVAIEESLVLSVRLNLRLALGMVSSFTIDIYMSAVYLTIYVIFSPP